jgi:DNA primase catalytic core
MAISQEKILEIREKANIVDIISDYISVEQRGKNYFAICPFHDDHNPSMSISPSKQIYKCFVCGATGNVFTFVMDYENVSFIEAVTTQTALALENARLLEATQRRAAQERVTTNIASKIWASTEIETILQTTLQELGRSLRISDGVIELGLNPVREIER